jgi:hypothetical protein
MNSFFTWFFLATTIAFGFLYWYERGKMVFWELAIQKLLENFPEEEREEILTDTCRKVMNDVLSD